MEKNVLITDWIQGLLKKYDLSLFDEFIIENIHDNYKWRFTPTALQYCFGDNWCNADAMLCDMARESFSIKKIRFKPEKGNVYFYVEWIGEGREPYVTQTDWDGAAIDMYNFLHDNCFRTAEAALKKTKEIYDKIQKEVGTLS